MKQMTVRDVDMLFISLLDDCLFVCISPVTYLRFRYINSRFQPLERENKTAVWQTAAVILDFFIKSVQSAKQWPEHAFK